MPEYKKFILEDLPKSAVVNSKVHSSDDEINDLINSVVSQHLNNLIIEDIEDEKVEDTAQIIKNVNEKVEKVVDETLEKFNIGDKLVNIDLEQIKRESYNKAMEEAKAKYEPMMTELKREQDFSNLLHEKLSSIIPEVDVDYQIAKISAEAISSIAKKLHLILPADFKGIIINGLIGKLKKFYKEGQIIVTINPNRYDFCKEVLQSDSIPAKLKNNFQITKDDKLGIDDCKMEWSDTCLEYNQAQLSSEISEIIEQLKSVA